MNTDLDNPTTGTKHAPNTEHAVAALWCEVLQMNDLPKASDNFFVLGGDSMTMTMLEFRINEELSVDLPPGALLNAQTLHELVVLVDTARAPCGASVSEVSAT